MLSRSVVTCLLAVSLSAAPVLRAIESSSFVVAGLKVMPETGNKAANYALFEKLARRAAHAGANFIVTPEGYLDGYLGSPKIAPGMTHDKLRDSADLIDGPWLKKVAALAAELKVHIMFGFSERSGDKVFNTVALFAPDGMLAGRYSKTHTVPGGELFDPGHELKVSDTQLGHMGVLICFDRQPPENARTLALRGAQFIVVPAYGKTSTPMDEDILLRARAHGIHWFEEPLKHTDFDGFAALRANAGMALAMGEREFDLVPLRELARRSAIDLWQPDILRLGGVEGWLDSAALARAHHLPVLPHYYKEYDAALCCTIPDAYGVESFDWVDGLIDRPLRIENGRAYPSDQPGWGFSFKPTVLAELRT